MLTREPHTIADQLEELLTRLGELGVAVAPFSRFEVYAREARRILDGRDAAHSEEETRRQALTLGRIRSELERLLYILKHGDWRDRCWTDKLAVGLSGSPWTSIEETPRSRSAIFELYVASNFRKAGLQVTWTEPDCAVKFLGMPIGIAIKRLQSAKRFRQRFTEASRQLRRSKLSGIIVFDLSLPLSTDHPLFISELGEFTDAANIIASEVTRVLTEQERWILKVLDREYVMGLLVFASGTWYRLDNLSCGQAECVSWTPSFFPPHPWFFTSHLLMQRLALGSDLAILRSPANIKCPPEILWEPS